MSLEINEIGITMRVRSDAPAPADAAEDSAVEGADKAQAARDELVDLCVKRVLRALRTAQER